MEKALLEEIRKIHAERYESCIHSGVLCYASLCENQAYLDCKFYGSLREKKLINNIMKLIQSNLGICLTSDDRYLHYVARFIARTDRYSGGEEIETEDCSETSQGYER